MAEQSIVVTQPCALAASKLERLADKAQKFARSSRSERTQTEYAKHWKAFVRWCAVHRMRPMPCDWQTLEVYVTDLVEPDDPEQRPLNPSSLGMVIAAIAYAHTLAGIPRAEQPHRNPHFVEMWAGIRATKGKPSRQVEPALVGDVVSMVEALPQTIAGIRDAALLTLGFGASLRRSELVALELSDVAFKANGLRVFLRRSKVDQEGQGAEVFVHLGRGARTCPARALRAWLEASGIVEGPIFRRVTAHGRVGSRALSAGAVATIVKHSAAAVGLDPSAYAGHSLRAGLATSAAVIGKDERRLMRHGRWSGRAMLDRYVRLGQGFDENNVTAGIGL